jgi:mono/diheme cytochrome c family protein
MGEVDHSFSQLTPEAIRAMVAYLRSVPANCLCGSAGDAGTPTPPSHKDDGGAPDPRGKMVFQGACVSCHN